MIALRPLPLIPASKIDSSPAAREAQGKRRNNFREILGNGMVRTAGGRAGSVFRCRIGRAILLAALAVPAPVLGAELSQPAPGSTIKRISPPTDGESGRIGGLEGFQGHSTAPGKAGAIPRQDGRVHRVVTRGADGAELRVITLSSTASTLAGVPPGLPWSQFGHFAEQNALEVILSRYRSDPVAQ